MRGRAKKLLFENGREFYGIGFGADVEVVSEVVFNTSMTGYQEIVSDLSYCRQLVLMTYPLIGNCGLADDDYESKTCALGGLIVREYNDFPSNYRYTKTLSEEMEENGVSGITGVDTREVVRMLREEGTMRAMLADAVRSKEEVLEIIKNTPVPRDLVSSVSCNKLWYSRTANYRYNIVAIDCGIQHSVIRSLNTRGCNVIVVPYNTAPERILALRPDGLFLSDGPGNPMDVTAVKATVKELQGKLPIFGIGLGHLLIALANEASIEKMRSGHHGGNQPVRNLLTGKIEITAQNHSYAVDPKGIEKTGFTVTHKNLIDDTVEGLMKREDCVFSVQYHPESAPGAKDSAYLFDLFLENISAFLKGGHNNA